MLCLLILTALCSSTGSIASASPDPVVLAQGKGKGAPGSAHVEKFDAYGLTLTIPDAFTEFAPSDAAKRRDPQVKGGWTAKLSGRSLSIALYVAPSSTFGFQEPEDVYDIVLDNFRERTDKTFAFTTLLLEPGAFGYAPYASIGSGPIHDKDGKAVTGSYCVAAGLLEKYGYLLEVIAQPELDAAGNKVVVEFLRKGIAYKGKTRDSQWSTEEVNERWMICAPPGLEKKLEKPTRSKHYIFLSNTGASKQMGESMEENYLAIQKMYPFQEVAGRRLLPVFLFKAPEEYYAFYVKALGGSFEEAHASKGVAWHDFYATYYDAPQDPVHIHEATHQIFANRLRLHGGGSWFQEGVAEYICSLPSDRKTAANAVRKGRHTKLEDFILIPSLIAGGANKDGGSDATTAYTEAAYLIEFVRESKWSKDKFLDWVHAIGLCPYNNTVAIERATQAVLGVDIAGLEAKWVEYSKSR